MLKCDNLARMFQRNSTTRRSDEPPKLVALGPLATLAQIVRQSRGNITTAVSNSKLKGRTTILRIVAVVASREFVLGSVRHMTQHSSLWGCNGHLAGSSPTILQPSYVEYMRAHINSLLFAVLRVLGDALECCIAPPHGLHVVRCMRCCCRAAPHSNLYGVQAAVCLSVARLNG